MLFPRWELEYTNAGYLLIPAELATRVFPHGTVVVTVRGDELWLLPIRGANAGGLLLKQRNPAGDRAVLLAPLLPERVIAGSWPAYWDEAEGALRIAYRPLPPGVAARASIVRENGRWVVYLDVGFWNNADGSVPLKTERKRIADYASEQDAQVAARWIERGADRNLTRAPLGF